MSTVDIRDIFMVLARNATYILSPVELAILYKNMGFKSDEGRYALASYLTGRNIGSFKNLSVHERSAMKELAEGHEKETKLKYYSLTKQRNQAEAEGPVVGGVWGDMSPDW